MRSPSIKKTVLSACVTVCYLISSWAMVHGSDRSAQPGFYPVNVNGQVLSGPNSLARSNSGRIMVPIAAIAVHLGDAVEVNATARRLTVRRQSVTTIFDAGPGQVRENGSLILSISNSSEIAFSPNAADILLPMEIAAAILDASISFDNTKGSVIVLRGVTGSQIVSRDDEKGSFELYQADYEYGLSRYTGSTANNLVVTATGRLFDGRFLASSSSSGTLRKFTPRNFSFHLERPNGQRFIAGDIGTGTALPLLTANVRGGLASIPIGSFTAAIFGGRADSGSVLPIVFHDDPDLYVFRSRQRFDSNILGGFLSRSIGPDDSPIMMSAGAMNFSGPARSGSVASSTGVYNGSRLRMQADVGVGSFKGRDQDGRNVSGIGTALDISGTYRFSDELSLHGRVTEISKDFLSPQSGVRDPISHKAVGLSWSPARWLSTTWNASTTRRPGRDQRAESYLSAAFGISPGAGKPRFYFSHSQSHSPQIRSGAFTTFNASHDLKRWRLFLTASRIKMNGPATASVTAGAYVHLNDKNTLEISQSVGTGDRLGGAADWRTSGLFGGRMSLSAGGGYTRSASGGLSAFERISASVKLPKRSSLEVSYMHTAVAGPTVLVQLRGSLFRKREADAFIRSTIAEVSKLGTLAGRVYQDVDGDGKFEAGIDKPQAGVKVRLDGNRYVESDVNGIYQFEAVPEGGHRLYLDLLSVRADLTILDAATRDLSLNGGQTTSLDFRLARTGRAKGQVWIDTNSNGIFDEGEQPLSEIRIVVSSGRDTLTDQDGMFTIADLAPGEQVFLIDEKSLPEKLITAGQPLSIRIVAGRETSGVLIPVVPIPAEVKRFPVRPRQ